MGMEESLPSAKESRADFIDGLGTSTWSYTTRFGITGVALLALVYLCWLLATSYVRSSDKQLDRADSRSIAAEKALTDHIEATKGLTLEVKDAVSGMKDTQISIREAARDMKAASRENAKAAVSIQQSVEKLIDFQKVEIKARK